MNLDPLAVALAGLLTALQTAILMYAAYHWPAGHHRPDAKRDEDDE